MSTSFSLFTFIDVEFSACLPLRVLQLLSLTDNIRIVLDQTLQKRSIELPRHELIPAAAYKILCSSVCDLVAATHMTALSLSVRTFSRVPLLR